MTRRWLTGAIGIVCYVVTGCADGPEGSAEQSGDSAAVGASSVLAGDLGLGARGDDVRRVQDYLKEFGYFPNAELARTYSSWWPSVSSTPEEWGVYDELTGKAVRQLQTNFGLEATGVVDQATWSVLHTPRCAVPDGIPARNQHSKFAYNSNGQVWPDRTLTWKLINTDDVTQAQAEAAISAAFATWAAQTSMTFTKVGATATADLSIRFQSIDGKPAERNKLAGALPWPSPALVFDTAETWSVAATTPSTAVDLQTVALHEIGHVLNLEHSSSALGGVEAAMYPTYDEQDRTLHSDDKTAISALYDDGLQLPGQATDIGLGADGSAWIVSMTPTAGGYTIRKWNTATANWTTAVGNGGALRIAVSPSGVPWVVNDAGLIFQRSSSSASSGTWQPRPGCAKDIGIGANGSVWSISCTFTGDGGYLVQHWNGANWVLDSTGSAGYNIAVDAAGKPWINGWLGIPFRKTSASPTSGTWEVVPAWNPIAVTDVGIGPAGDGPWSTPWVIGTTSGPGGFSIHVWVEQPENDGGAPQASEWYQVTGFASRISVGPNGPWIVNGAGSIFRQVK
jgi:peptidoglycan hydrolase-like protein with peptidoglycan-binding domain